MVTLCLGTLGGLTYLTYKSVSRILVNLINSLENPK
jgi:hypothetical protein